MRRRSNELRKAALFGLYQLRKRCVGNKGKAFFGEILGVFGSLCKLYTAVLLFETLLTAH